MSLKRNLNFYLIIKALRTGRTLIMNIKLDKTFYTFCFVSIEYLINVYCFDRYINAALTGT